MNKTPESPKTYMQEFSSTLSAGIKSMPMPWKVIWIFVCTTFGLLLLGLYLNQELVRSVVETYMQQERNTMSTPNELEIRAREQYMIDSLNQAYKDIEDAKKARKALWGRFEIQQEVINIKERLNHCLAVNYWSVHNGGDILKIDDNWYLEVYESSDVEVEFDYTPKEAPKIFRGWIWLTKEIVSEGHAYIEKLENYPSLNVGKAKNYMKQRGVKSTYVVFIKNRGVEFLAFSIDFNIEDAVQQNPKLLEELSDLKLFIKERLAK